MRVGKEQPRRPVCRDPQLPFEIKGGRTRGLLPIHSLIAGIRHCVLSLEYLQVQSRILHVKTAVGEIIRVVLVAERTPLVRSFIKIKFDIATGMES